MNLLLGAGLVLLLAATQGAAREASDTDVEGPLNNDTFVPTSEVATKALARGDRTLMRSRSGGRPTDQIDAFDAWRSALSSTDRDASVPLLVQEEADELLSDRGHTFARRTEGVEGAVLRRLFALTDAERKSWSRRFEDLASAELAISGSASERLARVERDYPATRSAALACLRLFDLAFEEGRSTAARTYLDRARTHAKLGESQGDLARAIESRANALTKDAPPEAEAWRTAKNLKKVHTARLPVTSSRSHKNGEGFERGVLSGLSFLDDGRTFIHHSVAVFVLEADGGRGPIFEPEKLIDAFGRKIGRAFAPGGQAWPLHVTGDGEDVFCVLGRALGGNSSAICRITPPSEVGEPATLRWVLSTRGHADENAVVTPLTDLLEDGVWEFQPGPALFGSQLLVQARQWIPTKEEGSRRNFDASRPRAWVLALDALTGKPNWARFVALGSDLKVDFGSRFGPTRPAAPAQPPVAFGHSVFCSTSIGIGCLLDVADGRLQWSFRSRRRDPEAAGWVATRAPFVEDETILWSPGDSDRLYFLRGTPDLEDLGLITHLPHPIGEGRALIGGSKDEALVLGFAGAARTISAWDAINGSRKNALNLRRSEVFQGNALVSDERVFMCTDRALYVFDRTRDLFLMESHPLTDGGSEGGGSVFAEGNRVVVVGSNRVFFFEVAPD